MEISFHTPADWRGALQKPLNHGAEMVAFQDPGQHPKGRHLTLRTRTKEGPWEGAGPGAVNTQPESEAAACVSLRDGAAKNDF